MSLLERKLAWKRVLKARREQATTGARPVGLSGSSLDRALMRISVLSTFTAQPLEPFLGMACEEGSLVASVTTAPFDQIAAQCLTDGSETDLFQPNCIVVWPRLEDLWSAMDAPLVDVLDRYVSGIVELAELAINAAAKWSATLVFVLPVLPDLKPLGVGDASNPLGVTAAAESARLAVRAVLAEGRALVVDADEAVRKLGISQSLDARLLTTARVPYTDALFNEVGILIGRVLKLSIRGAAKVAVVDADNTLWGGVVGEDGADGIDLLDNGPGEAFRAFQRWLLELRRAGMIIAVASKNNETDLWEAFERREMVLRKTDLAAWRVNWQPKSQNLVELADELNLGPSSFVFIDDNPIEVGAVVDMLPEVGVLQMPEDASRWGSAIAASGMLDRLPPTREDLGRAEGYRVETTRRELRSTMTVEEYRQTLDVEVSVFPPTSADVGRVAQLVAKTNQFSIGGDRQAEAEIAALLTDPLWSVRLVSAKDRYGDYGIVGATISRLQDAVNGEAGVGVLKTFVLSCRAMGRGIEEAMIADAVQTHGGSVSVTVTETAKNLPGRTFFASLGALPGCSTVLSDVSWPEYVRRV
jgi:FkbH-like protein